MTDLIAAIGSAVCLFFLSRGGFGFGFGFGCGSALVAMVTDYGFHNNADTGMSLAIVSSITAPLAVLLLWVGWRAFRQAAAHVASTHF